MKNTATTLPLRDGATIPQMGLGVMYVPEGTLPALMREAAKVGYRHFDTATVYGNEGEVGEGLRSLDIDRSEVFVTTKLHGMGVGLSISKTIIEAHGGRLWAEPNPGGGTVFHLTLKLAGNEVIRDV